MSLCIVGFKSNNQNDSQMQSFSFYLGGFKNYASTVHEWQWTYTKLLVFRESKATWQTNMTLNTGIVFPLQSMTESIDLILPGFYCRPLLVLVSGSLPSDQAMDSWYWRTYHSETHGLLLQYALAHYPIALRCLGESEHRVKPCTLQNSSRNFYQQPRHHTCTCRNTASVSDGWSGTLQIMSCFCFSIPVSYHHSGTSLSWFQLSEDYFSELCRLFWMFSGKI